MPSYNDEFFVLDSINSVLNQTYKNVELIIVDDASNDHTLSIIETVHDERIRVFKNKKNMGAAYSRNLAIKNANGRYIAFLDADDIWKPDKLEKQLKFMIENNYGMCCSYYEWISENGNNMAILVKSPTVISHRMFLCGNHIGCLTVVYKKEVCDNLQIPEDIYKRNDFALWLKLSEKTKCYCYKESLAFYRRRISSSISSKKNFSLIKYHIILYQKMYSFSYVRAMIYALINLLVYFIRKLFYTRKVR